MKFITQYSCKIKHYNNIFKETIRLYREAIDYFIGVCLQEWDRISVIEGSKAQQRFIEMLCITASDSVAVYPFDKKYYKFPCYLRRAAISEATVKYPLIKATCLIGKLLTRILVVRLPDIPGLDIFSGTL